MQLDSIEKFGRHQKLHSNVPSYRFLCGFLHCNKQFSKQTGFKTHAYREHIAETARHLHLEVEDRLDVQCQIPDCLAKFGSIKNLISHLQTHIRVDRITITCPYSNCEHKFKKRSSFSSHLYRNHSERDELGTTNCASEHENLGPDLNAFDTSNMDSEEEIEQHSDETSRECRSQPDVASIVSDTDKSKENEDNIPSSSTADLSSQYTRDLALFLMKLQGKLILQ